MTMTRSRLTAAALCALLVTIVVLLALSSREPARMELPTTQFDVANSPIVAPMPNDPAPFQAPRVSQEPTLATAGPDVAPTAAPGVAFNYRYAFRLPPARIAEVQERHAQLCERLTVARCRISGMFYRLGEDGRVEARLELKLLPAIARRFGRTSIEAVTRAEGLLAESEISGVDAGGAIRAAGRSLAEQETELARVEARQRGASERTRPQLDYEAQQLRQQIRSLRDSREADAESLATTPMLLQYGAGALAAAAPGERPSLTNALDRSTANLLSGLGIVLLILVTLLPWALAGLVGWLAIRLIRRRFPIQVAA